MSLDLATGTLDGIGQMDHSVTSEYRILGPPGTGKTTSTSKLVRSAAKKYGANAVLVTSFSRAAAAELANCDLPISPDRLGTLHSICFRALGRPRIAEAHVQDWNRAHPQWALTSVNRESRLNGEDAPEDAVRSRRGDSLLQNLNRCRGLMIDADLWPSDIRELERAWTNYKREATLLDFCDLIEACLQDVPFAPGRPAVIFADESQDLTPMQARLLRKWGGHAEYLVLAGDDDQTVYSFLGATPEALLEPAIPANHAIVLRQSHRVPVSIHELANTLIQRVAHRQPKTYLPRAATGAVHRLSNGSYKTPEYFILASLMRHLERGQTVMFLASCSYMLQPIIQVLRKNVIPFHNPYRKASGFWNPLRLGPKTAARRLVSLLVAHPEYGEGQRQWNYGDLRLWTEWLSGPRILRCGGRELLAAGTGDQAVTTEDLKAIFEIDTFNSLLCTFEGNPRALLDWWKIRIAPAYRNRVDFPLAIADRHCPQALLDDPQVIVGTIHSVKGGQADVVYLFPDLSRAGNAEYETPGRRRDSVIRLFYVGATRSRETLYICQRETAMAICM